MPECVVDAHVHLPLNPPMTPDDLVSALRGHGIGAAVILGLPPAYEVVLNTLDTQHIAREHERLVKRMGKYIVGLEEVLRPESLIYSAIDLLNRYGRLCHHRPRGSGYVILAGVDLSKDPEDLMVELEIIADKGFAGFKIISTIFFKYLDDPTVEAAFRVASRRGLPLVVHTGCDPGIWELPAYCKYGDPSKLEGLLDSYGEVRVVLAHAGSYSAVAPGVFIEEALSLVRRYENVYIDTSALPPPIAARAALSAGPERGLFGSDYPVVGLESLSAYILSVERSLREAGLGWDDINKIFRLNAEELFGVRCQG